jgi:hypothetical protein
MLSLIFKRHTHSILEIMLFQTVQVDYSLMSERQYLKNGGSVI